MKTERRRGYVELAGKRAGSEAFGACLHQQAKGLKAAFVGEGVKRGDDSGGVHDRDYTTFDVYFNIS